MGQDKMRCPGKTCVLSYISFKLVNPIFMPQTIHNMNKLLYTIACCLVCILPKAQSGPLRLSISGLSHSHVHGLLGRQSKGDIRIVGISESDTALAHRYAKQYNLADSLFFTSLSQMIAITKPEAVAAFGSIYDHLQVVQAAAPRGIHVMVEKPLAVNMNHARAMKDLAKKHGIHLLTNYETTWYPGNHKAFELLQQGAVGPLRKLVVRDGHRGPKKIGVNAEFLQWLTDPVLNGGGALTDFGCYGANLATWLLQGQRPTKVTCVTQQLQPQNNPRVDDEANILLTYDSAVALLQPSWNWPMGRKDMEVYGLTGALYADHSGTLRMRTAKGYSDYKEESFELAGLQPPNNDPFSLLEAVVHGRVTLPPWDLSSLENNLLVVEILDAARKSAKKGKTVKL
jgi:predicted dehydrogenase